MAVVVPITYATGSSTRWEITGVTPWLTSSTTTITSEQWGTIMRFVICKMDDDEMYSCQYGVCDHDAAEHREAAERFAQQTRFLREQEEQRVAERRRLEQHHREMRETRLRNERAAQQTAKKLFLSLMDEAQRAEYERHERVTVRGSAGGFYQIHRGYSGNVVKVDENGRRIGSYCAHPEMHGYEDGPLPFEDAMITQMLALRTDERSFLSVANET